jgi:hypothetical protein
MTAFFTASIYLSLSVDKVANGGVLNKCRKCYQYKWCESKSII